MRPLILHLEVLRIRLAPYIHIHTVGSVNASRLTVLVYARQIVEIILANLIINPASNKVTQKFSTSKPDQGSGQGAKSKTGAQSSAGGATRGGGGRGRR